MQRGGIGSSLVLAGVVLLLAAARADEVVVLACDFERDQGLLGWRDVMSRDLSSYDLDKCAWRVMDENGNRFVRATKASGIFGVTVSLKQPIVISDKVAAVKLRGRVRRTAGGVVQMGLTSRVQPEGQQGQAFNWCGAPADSGFQVSGCAAATESNFLLWRVDGLSHAHSERRNFLPAGKPEWHTWEVVFDRVAGTLALYTGDGGPTPVLMQKGVDLDGVTLRSLWLNGAGVAAPEAECGLDYDDLTVTYVPAAAGSGK